MQGIRWMISRKSSVSARYYHFLIQSLELYLLLNDENMVIFIFSLCSSFFSPKILPRAVSVSSKYKIFKKHKRMFDSGTGHDVVIGRWFTFPLDKKTENKKNPPRMDRAREGMVLETIWQCRTVSSERRKTNQVSIPRGSFQAVMQSGHREGIQTKHGHLSWSHRLWSRMPRQLVFSGQIQGRWKLQMRGLRKIAEGSHWILGWVLVWACMRRYYPRLGKEPPEINMLNNLRSFYRDGHLLYSHQPELKGLQIPGTSGRILLKALL